MLSVCSPFILITYRFKAYHHNHSFLDFDCLSSLCRCLFNWNLITISWMVTNSPLEHLAWSTINCTVNSNDLFFMRLALFKLSSAAGHPDVISTCFYAPQLVPEFFYCGFFFARLMLSQTYPIVIQLVTNLINYSSLMALKTFLFNVHTLIITSVWYADCRFNQTRFMSPAKSIIIARMEIQFPARFRNTFCDRRNREIPRWGIQSINPTALCKIILINW